MIAGRLTMIAILERDISDGVDAWGQPSAPNFTSIPAVRCFIYSRSVREVVDGTKTALIEDLRGMFALGANVMSADQITGVTDSSGNTIMPGRLMIEGPIQRKHTHLEAVLQRID